MTKTSARLHPAPKIGDTVLVPLADVDRSKGDPRNIMAVVVDVKDNNLIQVGNEHGVLRNLLSRNQYSIAKNNFVSLDDVARDKELTVRSFLTAASITGGTRAAIASRAATPYIEAVCGSTANVALNATGALRLKY